MIGQPDSVCQQLSTMGTPWPSLIQRAVGSSSGSPARKSTRRPDRSYFFGSAGSYFLRTRTAVGALNITVTLCFSTSGQVRDYLGQSSHA